MKKCYRCDQVKPTEAFTTRIDDRHYNMCRVCVTEILTSRPGKKIRLHHSATERTCYLCRRRLPVGEFTLRGDGTHFSACKGCNRHVFAQRRRARLAGADGFYTVAEWEGLVALFDHCPRCGRRWSEIECRVRGDVITADHIIPISKGGSNRIDNIQPLCYSCNSRKGSKLE
jgi:5-methylcytosine-specific restriction endonuclease McrA